MGKLIGKQVNCSIETEFSDRYSIDIAKRAFELVSEYIPENCALFSINEGGDSDYNFCPHDTYMTETCSYDHDYKPMLGHRVPCEYRLPIYMERTKCNSSGDLIAVYYSTVVDGNQAWWEIVYETTTRPAESFVRI